MGKGAGLEKGEDEVRDLMGKEYVSRDEEKEEEVVELEEKGEDEARDLMRRKYVGTLGWWFRRRRWRTF